MNKRTYSRIAVGAAVVGSLVAASAPAYASLAASQDHVRSAATSPTALAFVVKGCGPCGEFVEPTPFSEFPSGGTRSMMGIDEEPFSSSSTLTAMTDGDFTTGTSSASATVQDLKIDLDAKLEVNGVSATCQASPTGASGNGTVASGTAWFKGGSQESLPSSSTPNTPFTLSGDGESVTGELNKQVPGPDGGLAVDSLVITSVDGSPVDIIVGHAQCNGAPPCMATPMVNPAVGAGATATAALGGVVFLRRRKYAARGRAL